MEFLNHKDYYKVAGVYLISFTNGSTYIGQSINLYERSYRHVYKLRANNHDNQHLQNVYNKYGEDSMSFRVLRTLNRETSKRLSNKELKKLLTPMEQVYFSIYEPDLIKEFWAGAEMGSKQARRSREGYKKRQPGWKHTPEAIEKIRTNRTGKNKGWKPSSEHQKKLTDSNAKEFSLYHSSEGLIEGFNVSDFARSRGLRPRGLANVISGISYSSQEFYKSEEYYLDKSNWEQDYPSPESDYPYVLWDRRTRRWVGYFTDQQNYKAKWFPAKTEKEAYEAVVAYRTSLGFDSKLKGENPYSKIKA